MIDNRLFLSHRYFPFLPFGIMYWSVDVDDHNRPHYFAGTVVPDNAMIDLREPTKINDMPSRFDAASWCLQSLGIDHLLTLREGLAVYYPGKPEEVVPYEELPNTEGLSDMDRYRAYIGGLMIRKYRSK